MSDLEVRFGYHRPDEAKIARHERARAAMKMAALEATSILAPCRELSIVLTKLEEAMMWLNAGIAREGKLNEDN